MQPLDARENTPYDPGRRKFLGDITKLGGHAIVASVAPWLLFESEEAHAAGVEMEFTPWKRTFSPAPVEVAFRGLNPNAPYTLQVQESALPARSIPIDPRRARATFFLAGAVGGETAYKLDLTNNLFGYVAGRETVRVGPKTVFQATVKDERGKPLLARDHRFPSGYRTPDVAIVIFPPQSANLHAGGGTGFLVFCDPFTGIAKLPVPLMPEFYQENPATAITEVSYNGYQAPWLPWGINGGREQDLPWGQVTEERVILQRPSADSKSGQVLHPIRQHIIDAIEKEEIPFDRSGGSVVFTLLPDGPDGRVGTLDTM